MKAVKNILFAHGDDNSLGPIFKAISQREVQADSILSTANVKIDSVGFQGDEIAPLRRQVRSALKAIGIQVFKHTSKNIWLHQDLVSWADLILVPSLLEEDLLCLNFNEAWSKTLPVECYCGQYKTQTGFHPGYAPQSEDECRVAADVFMGLLPYAINRLKDSYCDALVAKGVAISGGIAIGEAQLKNAELVFTPNLKANMFVKDNPLAFLFAVILDQGIKAEIAWEMPFQLRLIFGHLDVYQIACLSQKKTREIFDQLPQKPRYLPQAAERVRQAAIKVVRQYDGKAESIWNDNPRAGDLQSRFDDFVGIGQKKAAMATRILGMDLNIPIRNWNELDVAVDDMIMRVFPRAGLSLTDDVQEIIESARRLNPSFPGALDYPCWDIGRRWCKPQTPDCFSCYIDDVCPKVELE